jgi:hypothetical protein
MEANLFREKVREVIVVESRGLYAATTKTTRCHYGDK